MKSNRKSITAIITIGMFTTIIYFIFASNQDKYILIPNEEITGIDISHYQQDFSFADLDKEEVQFIFMKATEGISFVDPKFANNWEEASEYRFLKGAYHFFHPNLDGNQQADNFIEVVGFETDVLRPVVDVEIYTVGNEQQLVKELDKFIKKIEDYYGVPPIIYTNASMYRDVIKPHYAEHVIWVAHYTLNDEPSYIGSEEWAFWQYTDEGRVSGYDQNIDLNIFNGDIEALELLVIK